MARKVVSVQCAICNREDSLYFADRDGGLVACGYCAEQRAEQAERELDEAEDIVRGFLWMLDEGILQRNIEHDGDPNWTMRSLKLSLWLAEAFKTTRNKRRD